MASALTPAAQAPQQRLNMSVSIATDAAEIEPGSAVVIQIAMKNDSKTPLEIGMSMPGVPEVLFGVSVTDERGRPAPATAFARKRPQYPLMGSGPRVRLGPDGSYRARLILTKRFDLTEPGHYIV
ncbi:MAG: hypothetical protein ACRD1L_08710, partial [Terriglobales bacterium]